MDVAVSWNTTALQTGWQSKTPSQKGKDQVQGLTPEIPALWEAKESELRGQEFKTSLTNMVKPHLYLKSKSKYIYMFIYISILNLNIYIWRLGNSVISKVRRTRYCWARIITSIAYLSYHQYLVHSSSHTKYTHSHLILKGEKQKVPSNNDIKLKVHVLSGRHQVWMLLVFMHRPPHIQYRVVGLEKDKCNNLLCLGRETMGDTQQTLGQNNSEIPFCRSVLHIPRVWNLD